MKQRDYKHLKELLDNGEQVVVFIQIHPCGYKKISVIAEAGVDDSGRKFYSIGYGYVFTDDAFFGQCKALELEY
jgi:hypothetical protein